MSDIRDILEKYQNEKMALYGLGTETKRFLDECGPDVSVLGLLDGYLEEGEIFGYPVISVSEAVNRGVRLIIVIARPGSCKVIARRIGVFCIQNNIALYDIRGRNLLENKNTTYDFSCLNGMTKQSLQERIDSVDVVSFDLFDTLITRKVRFYTDIFELLDCRLREKGIYIPDFHRVRLYAEKELSRDHAPGLVQIYEYLLRKTGGNFITARELAEQEWDVDKSVFLARESMCDILRKTVDSGKKVVLTTDSYYSDSQIKEILERFRLTGCDDIIISSEYGASKTNGLFKILRNKYKNNNILHIGDDEVADVEMAAVHEIETYRIYSGEDLFEAMCGLEMEHNISTLSDRLKTGMFISRIFNNPFCFEKEKSVFSITNAFEAGYLLCAPIITDFVLWLKEKTDVQDYRQVLFCARDGYLVGKLFRKVSSEIISTYFLASRTAAIRSGVENERDIAYVESMKYSGTAEEALKIRFGIEACGLESTDWNKEILVKAGIQRSNYQKYIKKLCIHKGNIAMFDFVAKGTTQMYLQKLFPQHMKGFYFLQLEPEFMEDKGLDIQPFYSEEEKDTSVIFDNYYILEAVLTSPYPQIQGFDDNGNPVFAAETRSKKDVRCIERVQEGICTYFEEYLDILPEMARDKNKKLGEMFLSYITKLRITDEDFLALKVEDPFFGRMTDMKDVIR